MTDALTLADTRVVADLRTYVSRARAAHDGAIRLQARGTVLAAYVSLLEPHGLGDSTPLVMGLRAMALAEPTDLDVTVPLAAISDRLARMEDDDVVLSVPPTTLAESWSGISAPRSGWERIGDLAADELIDVAKTGIREVAEIIPVNPGTPVVNSARGAVWGRELGAALPAGAAFAAYSLGFLTAARHVQLFRQGTWLRISNDRGHVLVRRPASL